MGTTTQNGMVGPVEQLLRTKVTRHRHNEWERAGDHALFGTSSENDGWLQRFQAPILLSPETDNLQKKNVPEHGPVAGCWGKTVAHDG